MVLKCLMVLSGYGTIWVCTLKATVLELVDKHDLESCGASHVGSIPTRGTKEAIMNEISKMSDEEVSKLVERLEAAKKFIQPGDTDIFVAETYIKGLKKYLIGDGGYGHTLTVAEASKKADKSVQLIEKLLRKLEGRK